ncbi:putative Oxysterol-binding protein 4 [Blattamonas nauphoetae]|uniref:Oxysterol-binding protein 4 n=1 Tax=Blattamonas nauphoetae TaxID=2049346 RepID=A0ABQ9XJ41_9EUKA|nr:putative Oxysterol-binding protein 4 [Blattamonas nauphoetae]
MSEQKPTPPVAPPSQDTTDIESESPPAFEEAEELVLDEKPRNVVAALLKQVRSGTDISRIGLPAFVLEPRSVTERLTDLMVFQHHIFTAIHTEDPFLRMIEIAAWFFSAWNPQHRGVNKPYNPKLGEFFRCFWDNNTGAPTQTPTDGPSEGPQLNRTFPDNSRTWYLSEQVSHHPPITALHLQNSENGMTLEGYIYLKTRFLGNSVVCMLPGDVRLRIPKNINEYKQRHAHPDQAPASTQFTHESLPYEEYVLELPSVYGRDVIFGTLWVEIAGPARITCQQTGLQTVFDFKSKSFMSSVKNRVEGVICKLTGDEKSDHAGKGEVQATLNGDWTSHLNCVDVRQIDSSLKLGGGAQVTIWDIKEPKAKKMVQRQNQQHPFESRNLWSGVTNALFAKDIDKAGEEKVALEEKGRLDSRERTAAGIGWRQRFFHYDKERQTYRLNYRTINTEELPPDQYYPKSVMDELTKHAAKKQKEEKKQSEKNAKNKAFPVPPPDCGTTKDYPRWVGPMPEITPYNCPDARDLMNPPPVGVFVEDGKDVDVVVTDYPPLPHQIADPWPQESLQHSHIDPENIPVSVTETPSNVPS